MQARLDHVKNLLRERNVQRVAVVDDAYDRPESMDWESWRVARDNPYESNLDADDRLDALVQVHGLRCFLTRSLELEVKVFGRKEVQDELTVYRADLWFFDLFWGTDSIEPEQAAADAAQLASSALCKYGPEDGNLPIVVLMSSRGAVLEQVRDTFTLRAEIPLGCFEMLSKPRFVSDGEPDVNEDFLRKLEGWLVNPEFRRHIFHFVRAVRHAANAAKDKFIKVLQEMAVNDYAYILKEGIKDDGHPLGDYLLWLMEPQFVHHLHEDEGVRQARRGLDGVSEVDRYLPLNPTTHFEALHQCRVWKRAHELKVEAVKLNGAVEPIDLIRLYQGDLLQSKSRPNEVLLIVSPACDLAFRAGKRDPDPDISVYLLPGEVHPGMTRAQAKGATRFFAGGPGEEPALFVWNPKRVRAMQYRDVPEFVRQENVVRLWCLRHKYVLELVHAWSSHISRVGLPVAPPAPRKAGISLHVREGAEWRKLREWSEGAWLENGEGQVVHAWFDDALALACAEVLNPEWVEKLGIKARSLEEIRELARAGFRVSLGGAFLWKGANDQVKVVLGRTLPAKESSSRVVVYLAVYEESQADRETEDESTE